MLSGIGAILIIVGFILGVYCGVILSLRKVVMTEAGEVKHGKLAGITVMCVISVILVILGQYLFFSFR
jgi:hypothetical protein